MNGTRRVSDDHVLELERQYDDGTYLHVELNYTHSEVVDIDTNQGGDDEFMENLITVNVQADANGRRYDILWDTEGETFAAACLIEWLWEAWKIDLPYEMLRSLR